MDERETDAIWADEGDDQRRGPRPPAGCICEYRWHASLGRLYGVAMMGGWVRERDDPRCPVHVHWKAAQE